MIANNTLAYGLKLVAETAKDMVYFPLWWYSKGLVQFSKKAFVFLSDRQKGLALWIWAKNIFRPMYGQRDWQGIAISIMVRIVEIAVRSLIMFFWVLVVISAIAAWILLPPLVLFEIFFQLNYPLLYGQ